MSKFEVGVFHCGKALWSEEMTFQLVFCTTVICVPFLSVAALSLPTYPLPSGI